MYIVLHPACLYLHFRNNAQSRHPIVHKYHNVIVSTVVKHANFSTLSSCIGTVWTSTNILRTRTIFMSSRFFLCCCIAFVFAAFCLSISGDRDQTNKAICAHTQTHKSKLTNEPTHKWNGSDKMQWETGGDGVARARDRRAQCLVNQTNQKKVKSEMRKSHFLAHAKFIRRISDWENEWRRRCCACGGTKASILGRKNFWLRLFRRNNNNDKREGFHMEKYANGTDPIGFKIFGLKLIKLTDLLVVEPHESAFQNDILADFDEFRTTLIGCRSRNS